MGTKAAKPRSSTPATLHIAVACGLISLAFKAVLLALEAFPFNADEAIVGLMARHILAGERPTFFYGQAYLGSADAALVAGGFSLLGTSVVTIRVVQALLYAGTVMTTVALASRAGIGGGGTWAAGLLTALPVVNTTLYTTVSIGGYGEALLLGNILLLMALHLHGDNPALVKCVAWGVLAGLAFWTFGLTLVYSLPAITFLVARWWRGGARGTLLRTGAVFVGGLAGAAPLVAWGARHGATPLLQELFGRAIAGASSPDFGRAVVSHASNLLLFGPTVLIGARPPWSISPLALPMLPLAVGFWILALIQLRHRKTEPHPASRVMSLAASVGAAVVLGFILTPFGADPSGRYFLPLGLILSLLGGALTAQVRTRWGTPWGWAVLAIPLVFAVWGNLQSAVNQPPGITTQFDPAARRDSSSDEALVRFLRDQRETRGFTTYWISYPLAFLSEEELIFVPRLPYHADFRYTSRDDRYEPYGRQVVDSPRVAYITSTQPWLDSFLREALQARGINYDESEIGGYHIFHGLSRHVQPYELGLGER